MDTEKIIEIEKKLTELEITSTAALAISITLLLFLVSLLFIKMFTADMNKN